MARRCPPGVICIESLSMAAVFAALLGAAMFFHLASRAEAGADHTADHSGRGGGRTETGNGRASTEAAVAFVPTLGPSGGVLLDPYLPPLRSDVPFPRGVPINVRTQGTPSEYRQVGILTRGDTILPLMGRPLLANRDTWNFYTMNDKNTMIKLPVVSRGKSCTREHGCDNIYDGDTVYVEGYNDTFNVTMYDNDTLRYIPYL